MATMKLKAAAREPHNKGAVRRLRREGRIPGVLYGQGKDSLPVSFDTSEFAALLRNREGMVIVEVEMEGKEPQQTLIREIQRDPLTGRVMHLDLQHISMTETVQVEVPIHIIGVPYGVKTEGGILEHHMRTVLLECLPGQIPGRIDVEVSDLHIGKSFHVEDLVFEADGIEIISDTKAVIVSVIPPRVIKTEVPAAEIEGEAAEGAPAEGAEEKGGDADKHAEKGSG